MSLMDVLVLAGKTGVILLDYFLRPAPPPPPIDYRDLWLATLGFGDGTKTDVLTVVQDGVQVRRRELRVRLEELLGDSAAVLTQL